MHQNGIRHIVIAGGGSAGWMAASALAKVFKDKIRLTLVESTDIGTVGVGEATIPPIQSFNQLLGIDERYFIQQTDATIKLGIEFAGWGQASSQYMHAFGDVGSNVGLTHFINYWLRQSPQNASDYWRYSLNFLAAKANKFSPAKTLPGTTIPGLSYAYHFDASAYARLLRDYAVKLGVHRIDAKISRVNICPASGNIRDLILDDNQVVAADFFIDCSGFRGLLIEEALNTGYESWQHWLPADSAIAIQTRQGNTTQPYTRSIAHAAGWQWHIPLQSRTGNGMVYSSVFMQQEQALDTLLQHLPEGERSDPKFLRFTTGRRKKQWHKNCLALGLSSGFLEPLESTSLHLIQSGIGRFLKLFPQNPADTCLADEFNRQADVEMEAIRDFIILHYHLNQRSEPFWKRCREMAVPDTLTERIALFADSGRVFRRSDELFSEMGWYQVLLGQGIMPHSYSPLANTLPEAECSDFMSNISAVFSGYVSQLPTQESYLHGISAKKNE